MRRFLRTLPLFLALAACGRQGFVSPVMDGERPMRRLDLVDAQGAPRPDSRSFRFLCSMCGTPVSAAPGVCPNQRCLAQLVTLSDYPCPNCGGTGLCPACVAYHQADQTCYFCGGSGWTPDNVPCVHCDPTTHRCAVCAQHAGLCGMCTNGRVPLQTLASWGGGGATPAATPPPATETPPEQPAPATPPEGAAPPGP